MRGSLVVFPLPVSPLITTTGFDSICERFNPEWLSSKWSSKVHGCVGTHDRIHFGRVSGDNQKRVCSLRISFQCEHIICEFHLPTSERSDWAVRANKCIERPVKNTIVTSGNRPFVSSMSRPRNNLSVSITTWTTGSITHQPTIHTISNASLTKLTILCSYSSIGNPFRDTFSLTLSKLYSLQIFFSWQRWGETSYGFGKSLFDGPCWKKVIRLYRLSVGAGSYNSLHCIVALCLRKSFIHSFIHSF